MIDNSDQAGFTVVELMIALSVVSMLMAVLVSSFHFGNQVMRSTRHTAGLIHDVAIIKQLMGDTLAQVVLPKVATAVPAISGNADALRVVSLGPRILSAANPIVVDIATNPRDGGVTAAWHALDQPSGARAPRQIIPPNRRVRFSYFGPEGWIDRWQAPDTLPALVRVDFNDIVDPASASTLVIPVRAVRPAICSAQNTGPFCGGRS